MTLSSIKTFSLVLVVVNLTACGFIYGEKGLIKDKSNDYLKVEVGKDLVIPESLKHENKIDYAQVPAISKNTENSESSKFVVTTAPAQILDVSEKVRADRTSQFPAVLIEENNDFLWQSLSEFFQDKEITPLTIDKANRLFDTGWIAQSPGAVWKGVEGTDEIDDFRTRYRFKITDGKIKKELRLQVERVAAQQLNDDNEQWEDITHFTQDSTDILNMFLSFYDQKNIEHNSQKTKSLVKFKVGLGKDEKGNAALIAHAGKEHVWQKLPKIFKEAKLEVNDQDLRLMTYFFNYKKDEPGFFASLFGAESDGIPLDDGDYQVRLSDVGERTAMTFRDAEGVVLNDELVVKLYPILSKYFGSSR